jgi:RNA 2',3'-cyclic 3'-phosphodiesterase
VSGIRSFIAIQLSEATRLSLGRFITQLKMECPPDIKWVLPEHLHFTLAFLGNLSAEDILLSTSAARKALVNCQTFKFHFNELGIFPERGFTRIVWMGIDAGAQEMMDLHQKLSRELAARKIVLEERPFVPHLTLGRVKNNAQLHLRKEMLIKKPLPELTDQATGIWIMRSDLSPQGSNYSVQHYLPF